MQAPISKASHYLGFMLLARATRDVAIANMTQETSRKRSEASQSTSRISKNINFNIPINIGPNSQVSSPWGQALQIFKKGGTNRAITLNCVHCGVNGNLHVSGEVSWTILKGLKAAKVAMSGSIGAGVELGIAAQTSAQKTFTSPIAQIGVPGFSIPDVITVGHELALSAEVQLGVSLAGQVLTGAEMNIATFQASLDLVDGAKSVSGGLKPSMSAVLRYEASNNCDAFTASDSCANGLSYEIECNISTHAVPLAEMIHQLTLYLIKVKNDVSANLFGVKDYDLYNFAAPITRDCIKYVSYPHSLINKIHVFI